VRKPTTGPFGRCKGEVALRAHGKFLYGGGGKRNRVTLLSHRSKSGGATVGGVFGKGARAARRERDLVDEGDRQR